MADQNVFLLNRPCKWNNINRERKGEMDRQKGRQIGSLTQRITDHVQTLKIIFTEMDMQRSRRESLSEGCTQYLCRRQGPPSLGATGGKYKDGRNFYNLQ